MFTNPFNAPINTTPWYRDLTTWLWFGGSIATVGLFYVRYKIFINDLPIIGSRFNSIPATDIANAAVVTVTSPEGSMTPTNINNPEFIQGSSKGSISSIGTFLLGGIKRLNPMYWFPSSAETSAQAAAFSIAQTTHQFDNGLYPFTEINPYDSWFKRLRISWFGETAFEKSVRYRERALAWNTIIPYTPIDGDNE